MSVKRASSFGFVGLGPWGQVIADRLRHAGRRLRCFGCHESLAQAKGVEPAQSLVEIVAASDVLILADHLDASLEASDILGRPGQGGDLVIDLRPLRPARIRQDALAITAAGRDYIEAAIQGGSEMLRGGKVTLFAAGDRETFDRYWPWMAALASRPLHVGGFGAANALRQAGLLMEAANTVALAQGLALAEASGVDPATLLEALGDGPAGSAVLRERGPRMAVGDLVARGRDLAAWRGALEGLKEAPTDGTPLLEGLLLQLSQAIDLGLGDRDLAAVVALFAHAGVRSGEAGDALWQDPRQDTSATLKRGSSVT